MRSTRAALAATVIATCAGGVAQATPSVWVVPFVALDEQIPADVSARFDTELTAALAGRREVELTQLKRRAASPIDRGVPEARAALAAGRDQYQKFNFGQARAELERAVSLVENAGVPPGEASTLTAALTELAVVLEGMSQHAAAREACDALLAIRPDIRFDPIRVPPNLIKQCEAVRAKRSMQTRRVTLTSLPPFAQLYVDGQPFGSSPVSVELPLGAHYLLYVAQNQLTLAQTLTVDGGSEPLLRSVQLPRQPEEKLVDALRMRLRQRGTLPQTADAVSAVGLVVGSDEVLVGGVERAAMDRLRFYVARVDTNKAKQPPVIVAWVHDDLSDLGEVMQKVAALVANPALAPGATFVDEVTESARKLDYHGALFGVDQQAGASSDTAAARLVTPAPPSQHKRTGLIVGLTIGAAVVVGVAVGVGVAFGSERNQPLTPSPTVGAPIRSTQ